MGNGITDLGGQHSMCLMKYLNSFAENFDKMSQDDTNTMPQSSEHSPIARVYYELLFIVNFTGIVTIDKIKLTGIS